MKTIWKYTIHLDMTEHIFFEVPRKAKLVHVGSQTNDAAEIVLWFEVNTEEPYTTRHFSVYGTGHRIPSFEKYCGTVVKAGGALVWHVYELV